MQIIPNKVMGYEVPLSVPDSIEEYNGMDKSRPNAALDDAIKYTILHGWNTEARDEIVAVLERMSELKRKMKPGPPKKDGTPGAEVPDEKHSQFQIRVFRDSNVTMEDSAPEVLKALAQIPFDPAPSERQAGPGRVQKEYYLIADGLLEKGNDSVGKAVKKLKKLNPGLDVKFLEDGQTVDRDSLAAAVKANAVRIAKQASEDLLAA